MKASLQTTFGLLLCASALAGGCGKKAVTPPPAAPVTGAVNPATPTPDAVVGGTDQAAADKAAADKAAADKATADKAAVDKAAADKAAADKAKAEEEAAKVPLTAEQFEALVMAVSACKLDGLAIDPKCPEAIALNHAVARKDALKGLLESNKALGLKLLPNESPALRIKAVELLGSRFGAEAGGMEALLAAYGKEKVKGVRLAFIRAFGTLASLEPKVAKKLIGVMDDADVEVRAQAVYALTQPFNKKLAGGIERLIKATKSDADPKLRQVACEHAGKLGDEKLLPTLAKLTEPKVDPALQESCMRGLVAMWADTTRFENASERAYRLTLRLLERTPRTNEMPSWAAISRIAKLDVLDTPAAELTPSTATAIAAWKTRASWYNPAELRRVLRVVLVDPDVGEMAAAHAVTALHALGLARGELGALQKQLAEAGRSKPKGPLADAFDRARDSRTKRSDAEPIKPLEIELAPGQPGVKGDTALPPQQP